MVEKNMVENKSFVDMLIFLKDDIVNYFTEEIEKDKNDIREIKNKTCKYYLRPPTRLTSSVDTPV